jgi:hypothetical protein
MFEGFRARRAAAGAEHEEEKAAEGYRQALASWQVQRDAAAQLVSVAQAEGTAPDGLVMHRGEVCYGALTNCSLVEERKGAGHFVAGSSGVSIPIGTLHGRPVRYRVGAARGHYVQGTPEPTAIATGTMYLTNQRIVFLSSTQTRECRFDKLVGIQRDDDTGQLMISVSTRQHPTVVSYGPKVAPWVEFHVELALAHWRGDVDDLIAQLTARLAELDDAKPPPPA